jgi:exonuclease VII large subunit
MENKEAKTVDQMTTEELQAYLAERRKDEMAQLNKNRNEYEKYIETNTSRLVRKAIKLNNILTTFFENSTKTLEEMREKLNEYGAIRANSKGGFHLKTDDGQYKLVYRYSTTCDWDERAVKAEELLKDFLGDVVKKRDKELFQVIMGLIEKNKEGKLELSRIQALYAQESTFTDPRWVEAIRLFKESFRPVDSKMRLEFYKRSEVSQKWEPIVLNLSSL